MKIKTKLFSAVLASAILLTQASTFADDKVQGPKMMESFTSYPANKFPTSFRTYPFQRGKAQEVYFVREENGNKYLNGTDEKDLSIQVFKRFVWDTAKEPYFSWQWRAQTLPTGAAETSPTTNDSACGVYVVFGGYTGDIIKYVWSTTLPVGTIYEKKPGKMYMVVLDSGPGSVGQWQTRSVDVLADYKKIFKKDPTEQPPGFGLLTDGNATHTKASCDYDNFQISGTAF